MGRKGFLGLIRILAVAAVPDVAQNAGAFRLKTRRWLGIRAAVEM
jgi:hypothetical protein